MAGSWVALAATAIVFKLLFLEIWLWNNDNFITLSTFYSSAGQGDYIRAARAFYEASVASCAPTNDVCRASSVTLHTEQTYSRPIIAFFGSRLADADVLRSADTLLAGVARATVWHVAASTALVLALAACYLSVLPRAVASYLAAATAFYGIVAFWLPERAAFAAFQPLLGIGVAGAAGVLLLAGAAGALQGRSARRVRLLTWLEPRSIPVCWAAAFALLVARVAASRAGGVDMAVPVPGAGAGLLAVLLSVAAVAVFATAATAALRDSTLPWSVRWVAVFLLVAFVSTGENFFSTAFHIAPRGHVYLLAAPVVVYVALRPNGRLLWLLPLLLLFHVSVAGLLFGCVAAMEVVAALRRRRVSLALVLSIVLLTIAGVQTTAGGGNAVAAPQATSLSAFIFRLDAVAFLPAAVVLSVLVAAGYAAWRTPDPAGDFLLRAVVLAGVLAAAGQLRYALAEAGVQQMDAAAYNYSFLAYYLGPIACAAAIFLLSLAVAARDGSSPGTLEVNGRVLALVTAAVIALAAGRSTNTVGRPASPLAVIARATSIAVTMAPPDTMSPLVRAAAGPGDRYLVGPSVGDDVTTVSILKMRLRAATGLLDPVQVTAAPALPRPASR